MRQAMWAADMMGDHTIEHCQSLLLLSVLMVCHLFLSTKVDCMLISE
jgi:hypothetical protein